MAGRFFISSKTCAFLAFSLILSVVFSHVSNADDKQDLAQLVEEHYNFTWQDADYDFAKKSAEAILDHGKRNGNQPTIARALVRLAYIEILFGKWGNNWEESISECERRLQPGSNLARAEYLIFSGHMKGKWQNELDEGIRRVEEGIQIATELQEDPLLVLGYVCALELYGFDRKNTKAFECACLARTIALDIDVPWCECAALQCYVMIFHQLGMLKNIRPTVRRLDKIWSDNLVAKRALLSLGESSHYENKLLADIEELKTQPKSPARDDRIGKYYWTLCIASFENGQRANSLKYAKAAIPYLEASQNASILELAGTSIQLLQLDESNPDPEILNHVAEMIQNGVFRLRNPNERMLIANCYWKLGEPKKAKFWQNSAVNSGSNQKDQSWNFIEESANEFWHAELRSRKQLKINEQQRQQASMVYSVLLGTGVLCLIGVSIALTRHRILSKQKAKLEQLVDARTESLSRAMHQAKSADKAKTEFLARMNHEIRNPLTAILGFIEILRANQASPSSDFDLDFCLEGLQASSVHLHELVDNILEVSRVEHDDVKVAQQAFNIRELAKTVHSILAGKARDKSVQFTMTVDAPDVLISSDVAKLRQILLNVVGNAIKFTSEGVVNLDIIVKPDGRDVATLEMEVIDSGCGIPEDELAMAFDMFSFTSSNRHSVGSGLGLYISKLFVDKLAGEIELNSKVGEGTRVHIKIPVSLNAVSHLPYVAQDVPGVPHKIVVIDDQKLVCDTIRIQLETLGCQVFAFCDPRDALERIKIWKPNFVLLDLRMPIMSGFEVFDLIRELEHRPTVIAMTGDATRKMELECIQTGFDKFVVKPMKLAVLKDMFCKPDSVEASIPDKTGSKR